MDLHVLLQILLSVDSKNSAIRYFLVYVDDIMVIGIDITVLNSVIANLQIPFAMKNLGQLHYLVLRPILIRHLVPVPIQICSGSFEEGFYVGRIAS